MGSWTCRACSGLSRSSGTLGVILNSPEQRPPAGGPGPLFSVPQHFSFSNVPFLERSVSPISGSGPEFCGRLLEAGQEVLPPVCWPWAVLRGTSSPARFSGLKHPTLRKPTSRRKTGTASSSLLGPPWGGVLGLFPWIFATPTPSPCHPFLEPVLKEVRDWAWLGGTGSCASWSHSGTAPCRPTSHHQAPEGTCRGCPISIPLFK